MASLDASMAALSVSAAPIGTSTGYRTHTCNELRMEHVGQTVTLAGWVQVARDMNHFAFVDLRDRYGITQVVVTNPPDGTPEAKAMYELTKGLGREFVLTVTGTVVERSAKNAVRPTGAIEVLASSVQVLNASKTPPFLIQDETDAGEDVRMQYRYLDIRRNPIKDGLLLRNKVTRK
jgi:aspartyl-tRNA synthetase